MPPNALPPGVARGLRSANARSLSACNLNEAAFGFVGPKSRKGAGHAWEARHSGGWGLLVRGATPRVASTRASPAPVRRQRPRVASARASPAPVRRQRPRVTSACASPALPAAAERCHIPSTAHIKTGGELRWRPGRSIPASAPHTQRALRAQRHGRPANAITAARRTCEAAPLRTARQGPRPVRQRAFPDNAQATELRREARRKGNPVNAGAGRRACERRRACRRGALKQPEFWSSAVSKEFTLFGI